MEFIFIERNNGTDLNYFRSDCNGIMTLIWIILGVIAISKPVSYYKKFVGLKSSRYLDQLLFFFKYYTHK